MIIHSFDRSNTKKITTEVEIASFDIEDEVVDLKKILRQMKGRGIRAKNIIVTTERRQANEYRHSTFLVFYQKRLETDAEFKKRQQTMIRKDADAFFSMLGSYSYAIRNKKLFKRLYENYRKFYPTPPEHIEGFLDDFFSEINIATQKIAAHKKGYREGKSAGDKKVAEITKSLKEWNAST